MNKEDKKLLIIELCARLPYNVQVQKINSNKPEILKRINIDALPMMRPYLRSISSMTKEETKEYHKIIIQSQECSFNNSESATTMVNDWLLSKHFDVRGLITKGLALEAPKDMYN